MARNQPSEATPEPKPDPARKAGKRPTESMGKNGKFAAASFGKNAKTASGPLGKNSKKPPKTSQLGTSRGIESMFRNSYRAQLDMITLAATKANIMISLNGLLVSILLISGAYFLAVEPMLIIPLVAFLLTCTVAIIFAVLAARPAVDKKPRPLDDFRKDDADLLVFEQFAKLGRDDYLDAMQEMIQNNDRIYRNMIIHIHALGSTADYKFNRLYISYNSFMIGLVISVGLLLVVVGRSALMSGV
ncbi:MAG: hypothetical protein GXP01_10445 [Alphaproteobacteria bacterium]|nr:hypothetical protein [Alphaproteobacteria bacterium]